MIMKAIESYPELSFTQRDLHELNDGYDLIFSNACLQWVAHHEQLIPELMSKLNPGGALAVQIPMNQDEPLFKIIKEVAAASSYDFSGVHFERNDVLTPATYFNILATCSSRFEIWETVYYHNLLDHQSLLEWVRSTRLRPYLACLDQDDGAAFEAKILEQVKDKYPVMVNGEVILRFKRFFFIAYK